MNGLLFLSLFFLLVLPPLFRDATKRERDFRKIPPE